MLKGFKEFISRGNVIELAVGVIIGAAFKNIVDALVNGVINLSSLPSSASQTSRKPSSSRSTAPILRLVFC